MARNLLAKEALGAEEAGLLCGQGFWPCHAVIRGGTGASVCTCRLVREGLNLGLAGIEDEVARHGSASDQECLHYARRRVEELLPLAT